MQVEQFVMAYRVDHDRLRALLPADYESLRPVLRFNAERRRTADGRESIYLELNTPVAAKGKRGWLNVGCWEGEQIQCSQEGTSVTFHSDFLRLRFTPVGITGGCPAEADNQGCFFLHPYRFVPKEEITEAREFCDCSFAWSFAPGDAQGTSTGKSVAVPPVPPRVQYPRQALEPAAAARIPCEEVAGAYVVRFQRNA